MPNGAKQVHSIAVELVDTVLGQVPADVMVQLDDALRLHLQRWPHHRLAGRWSLGACW